MEAAVVMAASPRTTTGGTRGLTRRLCDHNSVPAGPNPSAVATAPTVCGAEGLAGYPRGVVTRVQQQEQARRPPAPTEKRYRTALDNRCCGGRRPHPLGRRTTRQTAIAILAAAQARRVCARGRQAHSAFVGMGHSVIWDTAVSQMISSPLIITRCRSVVETELEQDEVQPTTEFGTDLGHAGHLDETESLMEPDRRLVRTIDSGNHRVLAAFPRHVDESAHEVPANT